MYLECACLNFKKYDIKFSFELKFSTYANMFKVNADATIFGDEHAFSVGAVIQTVMGILWRQCVERSKQWWMPKQLRP